MKFTYIYNITLPRKNLEENLGCTILFQNDEKPLRFSKPNSYKKAWLKSKVFICCLNSELQLQKSIIQSCFNNWW